MKHVFIIGIALLLFASCGRQQQAESVVEDFVEQQLQQDATFLDFSDVDSTRVLSDSLVETMRQNAGKTVQYQDRTGQTLMFIRTQYLIDKDTMSATFYLDSELSGVVAYKVNG
jgi:hypothetical protein